MSRMTHTPIHTSAGLQASQLVKEYPTPAEPLVVLRGIALTLSPGHALAIVGPSGSGKSTLLNILGTLDHPTRGTVQLNGVDPFTLPPNALAKFRAQQIGFVFQDHHLLPQCTALENLLLARLATASVHSDDVTRAEHLLEQVGLSNRRTHLPSELSGGERQRVAIARALMNRPALLLCDEPTGNLDAKTSLAVGELLSSIIADGQTMMIVVTHSLTLADRFPRRMRMDDGQLVEA